MKPQVKYSVAYGMLLVAYVSASFSASAQIQGGPNIAPNGTRFTYSPRFGYLGPPAAFVPDPPPPPAPYGRPGSMPMVKYPRNPGPPPDTGSPGAPPVSLYGRPVAEVRPIAPTRPAARMPGARQRPTNFPCPDGCVREPDDEPIK